MCRFLVDLLKLTGHLMHQQFHNQQHPYFCSRNAELRTRTRKKEDWNRLVIATFISLNYLNGLDSNSAFGCKVWLLPCSGCHYVFHTLQCAFSRNNIYFFLGFRKCMRERRLAYRVLVGISEIKILLGRRRRGREGNICTDRQEMGWGWVGKLALTQLICLRKGKGWGLLWMRLWTSGLLKIQEIFWIV